MRSNRLKKTEVMWCASARRQSQLPRCPITVACASVEPVSVVRDLGIYIERSWHRHPCSGVRRSVSRCFAVLRPVIFSLTETGKNYCQNENEIETKITEMETK